MISFQYMSHPPRFRLKQATTPLVTPQDRPVSCGFFGIRLICNPEANPKGHFPTPLRKALRPALRGDVSRSEGRLRPRSFNQHHFQPHGSPSVSSEKIKVLVFSCKRTPERILGFHSPQREAFPLPTRNNATLVRITRHSRTQAATARLGSSFLSDVKSCYTGQLPFFLLFPIRLSDRGWSTMTRGAIRQATDFLECISIVYLSAAIKIMLYSD